MHYTTFSLAMQCIALHLLICTLFISHENRNTLFLYISEVNAMTKKTINNHAQEFKMIGLNIAYYRKLKGITQLQLAECINISRTHMSNIEAPNMSTSVSLETLLDIADALDIPASALLSFNR